MAGNIPHAGETNTFRIVQAVRELFFGRSLAVGQFSLRANETTTTVSAPNIGEQSQIFLSPKTANAATALTNARVTTVTNGSFTITHSNTADADKTYGYVALG